MGLMVCLFLAFCLRNLFNCDNATVNFIDIILVFHNMDRLHWKVMVQMHLMCFLAILSI